MPSFNDFYVIFKGFCKVFLHKLVLKTAFLGLGWAQVYSSQLGLMPYTKLQHPPPPLFWGGGGGQQTNNSNVYTPYTYISLKLC